MTVLSTPPWKMEYSGIYQHRCSSALDFCSACSEWKEKGEQLNQVCPRCYLIAHTQTQCFVISNSIFQLHKMFNTCIAVVTNVYLGLFLKQVMLLPLNDLTYTLRKMNNK